MNIFFEDIDTSKQEHNNESFVEFDPFKDDELNYNDSKASYNTTLTKTKSPRYEEIQIRFNQILQKRDQLKENLSGSQIVYLLDFYIDRNFELVDFIFQSNKKDSLFLEVIHRSYEMVLKELVQNRRKLFSIRFNNIEIQDILMELLFENDFTKFKNKFLSIKLNREFYLKFLEKVFTNNYIKTNHKSYIRYYNFYKNQYTELKNLLLGNYIRYAFAETNKFFTYHNLNDNLSLEIKEDYFSGLMLVILKVIDKYDAFKGTLTSFIENWLKDYRTTFKAKLTIINKTSNSDEEDLLNYTSDEGEPMLISTDKIENQILEGLCFKFNKSYEELEQLINEYKEVLPTLSNILNSVKRKTIS